MCWNHKPDDPVEKSRLEKMGGEVYKDSESVFRIGDLSLSRAFGDGDNAPYISQKPDIFLKKITPQTKYIVMACDGLWDIISNQDAIDFVKNLFNQKFTGNIAKEDAEMFLSSVAMNLLMEDLDISDTIDISLVDKLGDMQWQSLLPRLDGKITLNNEYKPTSLVDRLTVYQLDNFQLN